MLWAKILLALYVISVICWLVAIGRTQKNHRPTPGVALWIDKVGMVIAVLFISVFWPILFGRALMVKRK